MRFDAKIIDAAAVFAALGEVTDHVVTGVFEAGAVDAFLAESAIAASTEVIGTGGVAANLARFTDNIEAGVKALAVATALVVVTLSAQTKVWATLAEPADFSIGASADLASRLNAHAQ